MARAASQWRGSSMIGAGVSLGPGAETDGGVTGSRLRRPGCRRGGPSSFPLLYSAFRAPGCALDAFAAQAASPGPCAMATVPDSPGRSCGQRSSRSIQIRTGTLDDVRKLAGDDIPRHQRTALPVDLLIQSTRPRNGSAKASMLISTGLPGATPGKRSSSRLASM